MKQGIARWNEGAHPLAHPGDPKGDYSTELGRGGKRKRKRRPRTTPEKKHNRRREGSGKEVLSARPEPRIPPLNQRSYLSCTVPWNCSTVRDPYLNQTSTYGLSSPLPLLAPFLTLFSSSPFPFPSLSLPPPPFPSLPFPFGISSPRFSFIRLVLLSSPSCLVFFRPVLLCFLS